MNPKTKNNASGRTSTRKKKTTPPTRVQPPAKRASGGRFPLKVESIRKIFRQGDAELHVLEGASLEVQRGEIVALVGESGCGKSTLLQIAGLLDTPDGGEVRILGEAATKLPDRERTKLRREKLGFIYQFHHLLPDFSALENVMLPQILAGKSRREARNHGEKLLAKLGLGDRLQHRPGQLSGGEQQRVAIARALANQPAILLADEPTGNLDPGTAASVFAMLVELSAEHGMATLVVTHNRELARATDRMITLEEGKVMPLDSSR